MSERRTAGPAGVAPEQLLFLPGASGNTDFWRPVAAALPVTLPTHHVGWPGVGPTPPDPGITSLQGLVHSVVARLDRPTALVAQSMGCVVAVLAALERPQQVTHLVLAALSGGVDLQRHGAVDWRPPRTQVDPANPAHVFAAYDGDVTTRLPDVVAPTLLLWGDADPLSPVSVGRWLVDTLPRAALHVVAGGTHTFCHDRADVVAPLVSNHIVTS